MSDFPYWLVFFSSAIAFSLSPGPDLIYAISRTVTEGIKIGLASAAGLWLGACVHVFAVAFGLSAILTTSAEAFMVVKYAGAAYLVYLGISVLRSKGSNIKVSPVITPKVTLSQAFRQGVLVDVLNPKVAIFFMAFLPQFVRPSHGQPALQLILLGLLVIAVAIPVEICFVLAASRVTAFLRRYQKTSVWLNRILGLILVSLGIKLALFELP